MTGGHPLVRLKLATSTPEAKAMSPRRMVGTLRLENDTPVSLDPEETVRDHTYGWTRILDR